MSCVMILDDLLCCRHLKNWMQLKTGILN